MNLLLAFAPFIAFVVVEHLVGVPAGLAVGAILAAALLLRDLVTPDRHIKLLETGATLLFGALAVDAFTNDVQWSIVAVRLRVDAGLMLIVRVMVESGVRVRQGFEGGGGLAENVACLE
jgi:hypothetical protein